MQNYPKYQKSMLGQNSGDYKGYSGVLEYKEYSAILGFQSRPTSGDFRRPLNRKRPESCRHEQYKSFKWKRMRVANITKVLNEREWLSRT